MVLILFLAGFFLSVPERSPAEEKIVIGTVERVILLPWGVKLRARIDTGAATSSLDARDLEIKDNTAIFRLPGKPGGQRLRLPVIEWDHIKYPRGLRRRPVVEMEICLGSRLIKTKVNLSDRSYLKYPLILGRNFLRDNFIVDVKRRGTSRPKCREKDLRR
jgi:hypothetical protein